MKESRNGRYSLTETVDESGGRRVVTTTAVVVAAAQGGKEIFHPLRESDAGNECLHCEHAEYRYIAGDKYDGNSGIDDDDDGYGDYFDDADDDDGNGDGDNSDVDGEGGGGSDGGTSHNDDDDGHIVHGDRRVARDSDRLDRVLRETRPRFGLRLR